MYNGVDTTQVYYHSHESKMNVPGLHVAFLCAVFGDPSILRSPHYLGLCHLHPAGRKGTREGGGTADLKESVQVASTLVPWPGALSLGPI